MSAKTIASRLLRGGSSNRYFHASKPRLNVALTAESQAAPPPLYASATSGETPSPNTASSSGFAAEAEDTRPASSSATVISSLILSRLPVVLREPSAFENAYFNYNQRLSEALQQPFARDFYFKKGSAVEARFNEEQAKLSPGFTDIGKPAKKTSPKNDQESLSTLNTSGVAEGVTESQPLPRTTEADNRNDVTSLDRKLDRTLYLVVKPKKSSAWAFPSKPIDVEKKESLHRAAPKTVTNSLGTEMDIWMVSHLPIALYKPAEDQKVYFLSAHILAGSPQLTKDNGDIAEFRWLTREEIQKLLLDSKQSEYWQSVDDLLDP